MTVAIFQNLVAKDGRRTVEIRIAQPFGQGYFASPNATLYSCAYNCELGNRVALSRAIEFCETNNYSIVNIVHCEASRAAWQ